MSQRNHLQFAKRTAGASGGSVEKRRVSVFEEVQLSQDELLKMSLEFENESGSCCERVVGKEDQHSALSCPQTPALQYSNGKNELADHRKDYYHHSTTLLSSSESLIKKQHVRVDDFPTDFSFDSPHKNFNQLPWQADILMNARSSTVNSANVTANPSPIYDRSTGATPLSHLPNVSILDPLATETIASVCYRDAWETSKSNIVGIPPLQPPVLDPPPPLAPPTTIGMIENSTDSNENSPKHNESQNFLVRNPQPSSYLNYRQEHPSFSNYNPENWSYHLNNNNSHGGQSHLNASFWDQSHGQYYPSSAPMNMHPYSSAHSSNPPSISAHNHSHTSFSNHGTTSAHTTYPHHSHTQHYDLVEVKISDLEDQQYHQIDPDYPKETAPAPSKVEYESGDQDIPISEHTYNVAVAAAAAAAFRFGSAFNRDSGIYGHSAPNSSISVYRPEEIPSAMGGGYYNNLSAYQTDDVVSQSYVNDFMDPPMEPQMDPPAETTMDNLMDILGADLFDASRFEGGVYGGGDSPKSSLSKHAHSQNQPQSQSRTRLANQPKKKRARMKNSPLEDDLVNKYVNDGSPKKVKRAQVKTACAHCRKSSKKCSEHRPCDRCVSNNLECVDIARVSKHSKSNCDHDHGFRTDVIFEKPPTAPRKKKVKAVAPVKKPEFDEEQGILEWISTAVESIAPQSKKEKDSNFKNKELADYATQYSENQSYGTTTNNPMYHYSPPNDLDRYGIVNYNHFEPHAHQKLVHSSFAYPTSHVPASRKNSPYYDPALLHPLDIAEESGLKKSPHLDHYSVL